MDLRLASTGCASIGVDVACWLDPLVTCVTSGSSLYRHDARQGHRAPELVEGGRR